MKQIDLKYLLSTDMVDRKDLVTILGISYVSIRQREKHDPNFPKPYKIGMRKKYYRSADVLKWIGFDNAGALKSDV